MTGMLASVKNVAEAQIVLNANVNIIDLKQPEFGALGALPIELVAEIVAEINGRLPVSATVGDLPMDENLIFNAVCEMAKTGVNFVKIGFFPAENWAEIVQKLSNTQPEIRLIAVLFADTKPDFSILSHLEKANFSGVMLDTMNKKNGSLTDVMTHEKITEFVVLAKTHNLLCGLAGSLRLENIAPLLPLNADYLGFRGALCAENNRVQSLELRALQQIRNAI
jgi:uncharacterized protein (UPF0264 family)